MSAVIRENISWWKPFLLGILAAAFGSLVGLGGGVLIVPFLTMWGLTQKRAQGTSLLVIVCRQPLVILIYALLGNIDWKFSILLAIGGMVGAYVGSSIAQKYSNEILRKLFGILLVVISVLMVVLPSTSPNAISYFEITYFQFSPGLVLTIILGFAAGFLATFFGIGGGIIFVPTGTLIGGLEQVVSQGSGFVAGFPTILTGFLKYQNRGEWSWDYAKWLIPGAWIGTIVGAVIADRLDSVILRWLFALFLIWLAIRQFAGNRADVT